MCTPSLKGCRGWIRLWWGERRVRSGGFGVAGWWGWKLQTNVSRDTFHPERPGDTLWRISARLKEDQTHLCGGNLRHYWRRENPNEILNLFCKLNGFLRKAINYGSNVAAWFCALQQPVCVPLKVWLSLTLGCLADCVWLLLRGRLWDLDGTGSGYCYWLRWW